MSETTARMSINVPKGVDKAFDAYLEGRGLQKAALIGRILTWWMGQKEVVRRVASLDVTDGMAGEYVRALRKLANDVERDPGKFIPEVTPQPYLEVVENETPPPPKTGRDRKRLPPPKAALAHQVTK
jgi:hypothetical protein